MSEVIDALGLTYPVIVGHSMGGVVAAAAVPQRPEGIAALGLLSSLGLSVARLMRLPDARVRGNATRASWDRTQPLLKIRMVPAI